MVVEPGVGHFLAESDLDQRAAALGLLQTLEADASDWCEQGDFQLRVTGSPASHHSGRPFLSL